MIRVLAIAAAALALSGCGVGAGDEGAGGVTLLVTRDYGATEIGRADADSVPEDETVMRLLQRRFDVETRYGGGFVQSIEGLSGGRSAGRQVDWFYYVNGVEEEEGSAGRSLDDGDRVWWDHHDWTAAMRVPAVVGSFPEPFRSGIDGRRTPIRIECADPEGRECEEVVERLTAAGARVAGKANLGTAGGRATLRIIVGTWPEIRADRVLLPIEEGPEASGIFARFGEDGSRLELLDERGEAERTVGPGAGLVAATAYADQAPTWVVTGTDDAGVAGAVAALEEGVLAGRFAVAVEDGRSVAVPVRREPER